MKYVKKLVSLLMVCAVVVGVLTSGAFAAGNLMGDANLDGGVDVEDALVVLRAAAGTTTLNAAQAVLADVTYDGTVNSVDALRILLYINGSVTTLGRVEGEDGDDIDI